MKHIAAFDELVEEARANPGTADIGQLCQMLLSGSRNTTLEEQLIVAGIGISKIVEVFSLRAEILLWDWEHGEMTDPVLGAEELVGVLRQSMTLNLDDLLEPPPDLTRGPRLPHWENGETLAGEIDKATLLDWVDKTVAPTPSGLVVAHDEDIPAWSRAVENYLARADIGVTLLSVQQALDMPLVEVWLGALHSQTYQLFSRGDFYDPRSVVIESIIRE